MDHNKPVIILIVSKSFGEVDWILPVLSRYKEIYPEWEIITVFSHKLIYDFLTLNHQLFKEFKAVSSLNVVPQEVDALFTNNIRPDQVRMILKDYNEDQYAPYKVEIMERCPEALVVSYPHSNHIYSIKDQDKIQTCKDPDAYSVHDLFLLGSEHDIPFWSEYVDVDKIRAFGYPRYDMNWVDRIVQDPDFLNSEEYQKAGQAKHVFFFCSRGPHPHYLNQQDYEYLIRSIFEQVSKYEDWFMLIKPHPRQDMEGLAAILADYDSDRWLVSGRHLMQLASVADVSISGWSSAILDVLAVGKPVIEFWRFGGKDPDVRRLPDGQPTTIYRELELAPGIESSEDLARLLNSALHESNAVIWQKQQQAFQQHCKFTDKASETIAKALFLEVEGKRHSQKKALKLAQGQDIVDGMIEHITDLVEQGAESQAEVWLDFMVGQFPDDSRVLNNLGVYLFNQGDYNGAVENLVKSIEADCDFQEAAVNLCQILMCLDRQSDAVEMVISFHRNMAESPGARMTFLQALSEQLETAHFTVIKDKLMERRVAVV